MSSESKRGTCANKVSACSYDRSSSNLSDATEKPITCGSNGIRFFLKCSMSIGLFLEEFLVWKVDKIGSKFEKNRYFHPFLTP